MEPLLYFILIFLLTRYCSLSDRKAFGLQAWGLKYLIDLALRAAIFVFQLTRIRMGTPLTLKL